jgi:tetratricopeptide (TPR) repeat protein
MTNLLVGLLGALVATNQPAAVSNLIAQTTGLTVKIPDPEDPLEQELKKIMADDDAAHDEVDGWIKENRAFADKGAALPNDVLNTRIHTRLDVVKKAYVDFLKAHPDYARAHLAYGSFLENDGDEEGGTAEYEKARQIDPKNPASWNQLANYFGHRGPVKLAFEYYTRAIELDPTEAVYYQNFGTTIYLFRKDVREYYNIDEQQVFNKALALYQQARKYDSNNFELAQDVAETYYGIKPTRTEDALNAWTNVLNLATNEVEREGVYLHLARFKLNAGRFAESHQNLELVTNNVVYHDLKERLLHNLALREKEAATNSTPAKVEIKSPPPP